jgi:hypothetical protein
MRNSRPVWFAAIAVVLALGGAAYYLFVAQPPQSIEITGAPGAGFSAPTDEPTTPSATLEAPRESEIVEARVETTPGSPEPAGDPNRPRLRIVDARTSKYIEGAEVRLLELNASVPQPHQGSVVELIAQAMAKGKRERSGVEGVVFLPPKIKQLMVVAWTKDRWNAMRVFTLHLDGPVEVFAHDADDRPVANVPLSLAEHVPAQQGLARRADATTDERGRAVFEHGRAFLERSRGAPLTLVVDGSFPTLVKRDVSLDDLGAPIPILVPPCGSVEVRVLDFDDREVREGLPVMRSAKGLELPFALTEEQPRELKAGRVLFPAVAMGIPVEFETFLRAGKGQVGPLRGTATVSKASEKVELVLGGSKSAPILVARVLDEASAPIARTTMMLQSTSPGIDVSLPNQVETDEAARLRLPIPNWPNGGGSLRLVLAASGERPLLTGVFDVPNVLVMGEQTLPDIVLHGLPFIASGRVVDQLGTPLENARVEVLERSPDDTKWLATNGAALTGDDGSFSISAELANVELGIRASANDAAQIEIVPLLRGSRGLELALERWASFAGSALIDPGLQPAEVNVVWITKSPKTGRPVDARFDGSGRRNEGGESLAYFNGQRLQAGTGRLEFRAISTVVLTLDPIELRPGRNDDLVRRIDLRGLIRVFNLTISDQRGEPIVGGQIHFRPSGSDEPWELWQFTKGRARILALAPELDLSIFGAPGRATFFERVRGDRDFVLDGPIWTRISLEGGNPLRAPDTLSLVIGLKEVHAPTAVPTLHNQHRVLLDDAGQASVAFPCPGKYAVGFHVELAEPKVEGRVAREVELQVEARDVEQELTVQSPRVAIQHVIDALANAPAKDR